MGGGGIIGELMTDGNGFKKIIIPSGAYRNRNGSHERVLWGDGNIRSDYEGYMDGIGIFVFSTSSVPILIEKFLQDNNKTLDDYDSLLLHQANLFIIKRIAEQLKCPLEKIPLSLDRFGNTSGTSIPLTICDAFGQNNSGILKCLISGFGVGLSWGVVDAEINANDIMPIIYTKDYYTEGGVSHDV